MKNSNVDKSVRFINLKISEKILQFCSDYGTIVLELMFR